MAGIDDQIAALGEAERLAVLGRAKAVRDALLERLPDLAAQPHVAVVDAILRTACLDGDHPGETLSDAEDMVRGLADRLDVQAMSAVGEARVIELRDQESAVVRIADALSALRHDGFDWVAATSGAGVSGPVMGR